MKGNKTLKTSIKWSDQPGLLDVFDTSIVIADPYSWSAKAGPRPTIIVRLLLVKPEYYLTELLPPL